MLQNYFKIAIRSLLRNKVFSLINIFGLAAGLATCILIMLYIFDESRYDQHHSAGERIYRVASVSGKGETWAAIAAPIAEAIKNKLPEVEEAVRLMSFPDIATMLMTYENNGRPKSFFEGDGYYADASIFRVLTYQLIFGNAGTALTDPNSVVISDKLSEKFFGKENPVGKPLKITTPFGEFNYTVKAVFATGRFTSHVPAEYFLSMQNNDMGNWVKQQTSFTNNNVFFTYLKVRAGTHAGVFEQKLNHFYTQQAGADMKAAGYSKKLFLQPVKDIYLRSSLGNEMAANGNITYLYILGSIGLFILLIACINFMNLSTARSQKRSREVGVRKVMGAQKNALIGQFLTESFLTALIALLTALLIVQLILPFFNTFTAKDIQLFDDVRMVYRIGALSLLTGLLAGLYPAFYLSAFKPVVVLKGKLVNHFSAALIRRGLVMFQFTISICLIAGVIIIWKQLELLENQQLGFNKEQKLVLPLQRAYKSSAQDYTRVKNELLKNPAVNEVTAGSAYPGAPNLSDMLFYASGKTVSDIVDISLSAIDDNYIQTLGFTLLSGRLFTKDSRADSAGIILNETAVKALGYEVAEAPGRKILYDYRNSTHSMYITGVVKDFNFESLHNKIKPCGFTTNIFANKYSFLIASIDTKDNAGLIKEIAKTWRNIYPDVPFEYSLLDQDFRRNYQKEQRTAGIIGFFTVIAILVACLGLFGLSAFSAEQRTKEIGIRKVLGASLNNITALLSSDFIKPVVMAVAIASPLAWYGMQKWLNGFAYKINLSWWIFAAAGLLAVVIALVTVSVQAIKAALSNPVKSLRSE